MTYTRPNENTLGTLLNTKGKPRRGSSSTPAGRILRDAATGTASLGTGYLGIGLSVIAGVHMLFMLVLFLTRLDTYPDIAPVAFAWLLLIVSFASVALTIIIVGERMPHWLFAALAVAILGIIALDLIAIWPLQNVGGAATASLSAAFMPLLAVTMRRTIEIVSLSVVVTIGLATAILLTTPLTTQTTPAQLWVLAVAAIVPTFGAWLVSRFRRMVELELDRVLVQSTVSAPRLAVGLLASEQLARLDLAAEELFDSIAESRTDLPLAPETASIAASLATELRLHLLEGRRETWLYHAVTESEALGRAVTLSDPNSLAGLLDADQRDGLLSGVWLLISDKGKSAPRVKLELGPVAPRVPEDPPGHIRVPIALTTGDIARNRIDPATFNALSRVGALTLSQHDSTLRIELDCLVLSPSEQYHGEQAPRS